MLQVYMDDSGSHDDSHNCIVAGYWGSVVQWSALEAEWRQVLSVYGQEEFKSNKFWRKSSGKRVSHMQGGVMQRLLSSCMPCSLSLPVIISTHLRSEC